MEKHEEPILEFIISYKRRWDGNSPPVRTIAKALKVPQSTVYVCLVSLEENGRIRRPNRQCNAIVIPNGEWNLNYAR